MTRCASTTSREKCGKLVGTNGAGSCVNSPRPLTEPPEYAGGRLMPTIVPHRADRITLPRRTAVRNG
jgi:hypothetical protein